MKKLFLYVFTVLSGSINAQIIDKINDASDENSQRHSSNHGYSHSSYSNNATNDNSCSQMSNCVSGCLSSLNLLDNVIKAQEKVIQRKDSIPEVLSLEILESFGRGIGQDIYMNSPRFRANLGLISPEIRIFSLYESRGNVWRHYHLIDFHLLQFNLCTSKEFKLRAGIGLTKETYSNNSFFDWGISTDICLSSSLRMRLDYRQNRDFETSVSPRVYFGGGLDYSVYRSQSSHFVVFLGFDISNTIFYNKINNLGLGPTINLRLQ